MILLGQRKLGSSLHREKPSSNITSLCFCQWLGTIQLHETPLPWQGFGENNCIPFACRHSTSSNKPGANQGLRNCGLWHLPDRQPILQLAAPQKMWLTLQVTVPSEWIDAIFPGVRQLFQRVQARNARMQSGKRQAEDLMSDKAAEGFLQIVLYSGICFWENLPFRTQR